MKAMKGMTMKACFLLGLLLFGGIQISAQESGMEDLKKDSLYKRLGELNRELALMLINKEIEFTPHVITTFRGAPSICHIDSFRLYGMDDAFLYQKYRCDLSKTLQAIFTKYDLPGELKGEKYAALLYPEELLTSDKTVIEALGERGGENLLRTWLGMKASCDRQGTAIKCRTDADLLLYNALHSEASEVTVRSRGENILILVWDDGSHRIAKYFMLQGAGNEVSMDMDAFFLLAGNGVYLLGEGLLWFGEGVPDFPVVERYIGHRYSHNSLSPETQGRFGLEKAKDRQQATDRMFELLFPG